MGASLRLAPGPVPEALPGDGVCGDARPALDSGNELNRLEDPHPFHTEPSWDTGCLKLHRSGRIPPAPLGSDGSALSHRQRLLIESRDGAISRSPGGSRSSRPPLLDSRLEELKFLPRCLKSKMAFQQRGTPANKITA